MHGHQAIVFLQLHISTVDREVHHSKHKTTPFLFEAGRPGGACTCAHTAPTQNFDRALVLSLALLYGVLVRVHGLVYTHAVNVHVYVCAQLHITFFTGLCPKRKKISGTSVKINKMKGDVGMSLHEKEGNKKNLHQANNPSAIPTSLFLN